ncbi:MAG: CsgG/HfaB family protein [Campylobacterota bacterium]|nr:CsgG/HfaB family protein [Campylobacterota bacterium]
MTKTIRNIVLSGAAIAVLTGCGGNKLDVLSYPTKVKEKVNIPEICMAKYKSAMPTVAVIPFTNNSTFGKAEMENRSSNTNSTRKTASAGLAVANSSAVGVRGYNSAGIASSSAVAGISASSSKFKSNSKSSSVKRSVDAKLSASVTGPLEALIVASGGAKLFTRTDMNKIDKELKFQDSGLIDPSSAVAFGKTSGVRYIITGSIDNVEQKYRDNESSAKGVKSSTDKSENKALQMLGSIAKLGASMTDGMIISTKMSVKILDVETGKIVFTKQLESSGNIGKIKTPTYDQVVGGIKAAMIGSLPALNEEFANYFAVKGYITQIKKNQDNEIIAQVNIGRDMKVSENQLFKVYQFDDMEDPMTGVKSCDVIETTTKLRASQQITKNRTWVTIEEGEGNTLKLGQLVQKSHEKAGFAIPKLPF